MAEQVTFTTEQQALVDKLVGEARTKAREKATADTTAAQQVATDKAAQEQAAAAKEWEKLAGMHAARVKELEPFEAQAKAYLGLVEGMLKDEVKKLSDVGKKAVAALPDSMTALDKLNWLNLSEALFEVEPGDGVGTPRRPKSKGKKQIEPGKIARQPIRL